jgi:transcriptional regulator with XRE-family HTH domain
MTQGEWKRIFGDNLVDILEEQGMSQAQLARDTGLSTSRISDYINGNATPTVFAIINMAYALDMSVDEFVDFGERIEKGGIVYDQR